MKDKRKIYGSIFCDAYGVPYKMIVVEGRNTTEIPVSKSTLKVCKKAAKEIFGVTDLYISLIQEDGK